jgi:hypothetical protein
MLGAASLLPAVLSGYSIDDIEGRKKFLNPLVATFVRHSVIGSLEMSKLEDIAFKIARQLRADKAFEASISKLAAFVPTDDQFTENRPRLGGNARAERTPSSKVSQCPITGIM